MKGGEPMNPFDITLLMTVHHEIISETRQLYFQQQSKTTSRILKSVIRQTGGECKHLWYQQSDMIHFLGVSESCLLNQRQLSDRNIFKLSVNAPVQSSSQLRINTCMFFSLLKYQRQNKIKTLHVLFLMLLMCIILKVHKWYKQQVHVQYLNCMRWTDTFKSLYRI